MDNKLIKVTFINWLNKKQTTEIYASEYRYFIADKAGKYFKVLRISW